MHGKDRHTRSEGSLWYRDADGIVMLSVAEVAAVTEGSDGLVEVNEEDVGRGDGGGNSAFEQKHF